MPHNQRLDICTLLNFFEVCKQDGLSNNQESELKRSGIADGDFEGRAQVRTREPSAMPLNEGSAVE